LIYKNVKKQNEIFGHDHMRLIWLGCKKLKILIFQYLQWI